MYTVVIVKFYSRFSVYGRMKFNSNKNVFMWNVSISERGN